MNLKPEELTALELLQRKVKPEGQSPIERLAETGNKAGNYIESADGMIKDMRVIDQQLSREKEKETSTSLGAGTNQPKTNDTTELTKAIKQEIEGPQPRRTEEEMEI